ncbi:MAG: ATP-binding cassette domain-containing protein [Deltaproteobacteria bacterium]
MSNPSQETAQKPVFLDLRNISKSFGAIEALKGINMQLYAGEVVGLMGDNGAGKSTLIKILSGNYQPTNGELYLEGHPQQFNRPVDARTHGIEVVYQDLALCDHLTAAHNVFLGREKKRSIGPLKILDNKHMFARAGEIFTMLKSETRPRDKVKQMSGGQRQAVAIARTQLSSPQLVLMDEPTVSEVLGLIKRLQSEGVGVLLISHRMPDIFAVCDRVVVLRRGEKVADKPISQTSQDEVTGLITGAVERA